MGSIKLKFKESFGSFGSLKDEYPNQLTGVMTPVEFTNIINTINTCKGSFNKLFLLFLLGPIAAIALFIYGGIKFKKIQDEKFEKDWQHFNFDESLQDDTTLSAASLKPGKPFFFFILGAVLFLLGVCIVGIAYCIFKTKVLGKIEETLVPLNQQYASRQIQFELLTELVDKLVPDWEYSNNRNNQAYMQNIKFDSQGRPYKQEEEHYLIIKYSNYPMNPYNQPQQMPIQGNYYGGAQYTNPYPSYPVQTQPQPQQPQPQQPPNYEPQFNANVNIEMDNFI